MKTTFFFFFLCGAIKLFSQNLVPNSSFELIYNCDSCHGFISNMPGISKCVTDWYEVIPRRSRYCNPCIHFPNDTMYSVPKNDWGTQYARTGQAYAAIGFTIFLGNERDYISVKLTQPLAPDKRYYARFFASLADSSCLAVDAIGAYFSVGILDTTGRMLNGVFNITDVVPQIRNTPGVVFRDMENWVMIGGYFTAQGGEDNLTIGCYVKNEDLDTAQLSGISGYRTATYYIDDVYVGDSATVGISGIPEENTVRIYPNPVQNELTVNFFTAVKAKTYILLTDVLGNTIIRRDLSPLGNTATIDVGNLKQGVYFVRVYAGESLMRSEKILKMKNE